MKKEVGAGRIEKRKRREGIERNEHTRCDYNEYEVLSNQLQIILLASNESRGQGKKRKRH